MSVVNVVALPRGIDESGQLRCALVWSPLPATTDKTVGLPDPTVLADWPDAVRQLVVTVQISTRTYTGELDLEPLRSDVWKAVVAGAPTPSEPPPANPFALAPPLVSYSTSDLHLGASTLQSQVQQHGWLRADLPFVATLPFGSATPGPGPAGPTSAGAGTATSTAIADWASSVLSGMDTWTALVTPKLEPNPGTYHPPAPLPPPTLAEILAAALSFPTMAEALGLVVGVRLTAPPLLAVADGPHWIRATVTDPTGRLTLRSTASAPCLLGPSSFTLLAADPQGGPAALDRLDASPAGPFDILDYDPLASLTRQSHDLAHVQPQTSRGFEINRPNQHELLQARRTRRDERLKALAAGAPVLIPTSPPTAADAASSSDYLTGVRVDVAVASREQHPTPFPIGHHGRVAWRSLMWRHVEVSRRQENNPGPSFTSFETDEEGQLSLVQLRVPPEPEPGKAPEELPAALDEHIGSWTGWSLAAPRVGLGQVVGPAENGGLADPGALPDDFAVRAVVRPPRGRTQPTQALTPLRFGSSYRFRLRPVDVSGWSPPPPQDEAACSEAMPFLRREKIAAPVVVLGNVPTEGETAEHLVIRSVAQDPRPGEPSSPEAMADALRGQLHYPYAATSVRHVLPPSTSLVVAEQHGAFDPVVRDPGRGPRAALRIACKVDGAFTRPDFVDTEAEAGSGPADTASLIDRLVIVPRQPSQCPDLALATLSQSSDTSVDALTGTLLGAVQQSWPALGEALLDTQSVAYLGADPLRCPHLPDVAVTTLVARLLHDGDSVATASLDPYAGGHAWPEPRGWRIVLAAGTTIALLPDPESRTLTVHLPAGLSAELRVSGVPSDDLLDLFHLPATSGDGLPLEGRARLQDATRTLVRAGAHPQLSDVLVLTLRHAVMRPNVGPRNEPLLLTTPVRTPSGADLRLTGHLLVDRDSTAGVSVSASWSSPPETGAPTPLATHSARLDRLTTEDADAIELVTSPIEGPPVAPRAPEGVDITQLPPPTEIDLMKIAYPGPVDPGDLFTRPEDIYSALSKKNQVHDLTLPADATEATVEALRAVARTGRVGLAVRDTAGQVRTATLGLATRGGLLRTTTLTTGLTTAAGAIAGQGSVPVPHPTHLQGASPALQPTASPAGDAPGGAPAVASLAQDIVSTDLGQVDLAQARQRNAVERVLGVEAGAFTVLDAVTSLGENAVSAGQALLDAYGSGARSAILLAPLDERRDSSDEVQQIWVSEGVTHTMPSYRDYWHHLADTRHVDVTYSPVAHTRYRDCYPTEVLRTQAPSWADALGLSASWDRPGRPLLSRVVASVAPPVPTVTRLISGEHGDKKVLPGLRIYLGSSWNASGPEEKLGVLMLATQSAGLPSALRADWDPAGPRPVSDVLSVVGTDPAELSRFGAKADKNPLIDPVRSAPPREAPGEVRYLVCGDFAKCTDVKAGFVGPKNQVTYEHAVYPLRLSGTKPGLKPPTAADVMAFPVSWSVKRHQYYADLRFTEPMSGAFVRLTLCRYQPWALVKAPSDPTDKAAEPDGVDLRCSALLTTEFVWVNGTILPRVVEPTPGT